MDINAIIENARDYAEGTELAAALETGAPIEPSRDQLRQSWVRRWLDLSDWARQRELRVLERNLVDSLEELRCANEVAQRRAREALECSIWADGFFHGVVQSSDPEGKSEVSRRWVETKSYRQDALEALKIAAEANHDYLDAKGAITLAQARSQAARHHFTQVRETRIRAVARGFLLTFVVLATVAFLLHYRFHTR
jgi:hypothetical protein